MSRPARPPRRGATRGRTASTSEPGDNAPEPPASVVSAQPSAPTGSSVWAVVDAAVTEVVARWPYGDHSRLTAKDIEATACALAAALRDDGPEDAAPTLQGLLPFVPARRVLESLRGAV